MEKKRLQELAGIINETTGNEPGYISRNMLDAQPIVKSTDLANKDKKDKKMKELKRLQVLAGIIGHI